MKQSITFIVNSEPPEIRVAELRNNRLFDVDIERGSQGLGNIYRGVIANIVPGMEAYFVEIGTEKKGLLHFRDCINQDSQKLSPTSNLRVGQPILVQVSRPAVGKKGPRLTQRLSLPGRYLVLVSPWDAVGVSRRIESETERGRLKTLGETYRPLDYGLIVRTEAEGVTDALIKKDVNELVQQITAIQERFLKSSIPELLNHDLGLLGRIIRDRFNENVEKVIIDSIEEYAICRSLMLSLLPQHVDCIQYYSKPKPIFDFYSIENRLAQAKQKTITLPHGGSIIIEETEALTAIDVNTGRFTGRSRLADTIVQTNLEAVEEVALQLRLRGIGGIIVVDFIDMERTRDRIQVMNSLEAALKLDHVKTHIVHLSPSGLVEITRQREGLSLKQLLNQTCPVCKGEGAVTTVETAAIQARRQLRQVALENPGRPLKIKLHPSVASLFIGSSAQYIMNFEKSINANVVVRIDKAMNVESTYVEVLNTVFTSSAPESARFTLGMHDKLYPENNPEFAAWEDILVLLPPELPIDENQPHLQDIIIFEIQDKGRWYATSKIIRPQLR